MIGGRFNLRCFPRSPRRWLTSRLRISKMATLETLHFDNLALRALPLDEEKENYVRMVPGACFSLVAPTPVSKPVTVVYSCNALSLIDLPESELKRDAFAEYFSGNRILPGSKTAAHCYCGHQFGHFAGQLGDGAAIYLGEVVNGKGEKWEIQLKGAGLTPYSRHADGRKVLRSSIREFLCSEAMHHLGIPTTRDKLVDLSKLDWRCNHPWDTCAGTCITSDTVVPRDIFYNGNTIGEKASIVLRIAPTFLRFGSFEIFKPLDRITGRKGPSVGRTDILVKLLDYTVKTFYKEIYDAHPSSAEDRYLAFYKDVIVKTAKLAVEWQSVGFCHGVLNTDNMSIVGLTIDYGPFGFLDYFDRDYICNDSDSDRGRYTYRAQPEVCKWNLEKLAEAIQDALPLSKSKAALEELYDNEYEKAYMGKMRLKLGLMKEDEGDKKLIESLLDTMQETGADFTNTFRCLSKVKASDEKQSTEKNGDIIKYITSQCQTVEELKKTTQPSMGGRELQMFTMLIQSNPSLLQQLGGSLSTIQKELDKMEALQQLEELKPCDKIDKDVKLWHVWISKYSARLVEDFKDVDNIEQVKEQHKKMMNSNNPRFILRNYIAQNAITAAENGDFSEVRRVLELLQTPYSDTMDVTNIEIQASSDSASCSSHASPAHLIYDNKPPPWSLGLRVT